MSRPHPPDRLSDDMAEAIGHAVSAFGYLEEVLKRAIFSLTLKGLGETADAPARARWRQQMADIADDSLGTLIDAFDSAMRGAQTRGRKEIAAELRRLKSWRNLLCHASWRQGDEHGTWRPTFITHKGENHPEAMAPEDVLEIHAETLAVAERAFAIMQATGIDGDWIGDD